MLRKAITSVVLLLASLYGSAQIIDTNIVIINFGHLDRNGIARQIERIRSYQPKIIGMDVFFTKDSLEHDTFLLRMLKTTPNLVMVCGFNDSYPQGESLKLSHPKFAVKNIAHNNFMAGSYKKELAVVAFRPFIEYSHNTYTALSIKLAQAANPMKTAKFLTKNSDQESIPIRYQYPGLQFTILTEAQLNEAKFSPSLLQNKIVLIGFAGPEEEDIHIIPYMEQNQPARIHGIKIHAHIIHMILAN